MTLIFGMKEAEIPAQEIWDVYMEKGILSLHFLGDAIKGAIVVSIAEYLLEILHL